MTRQPDLPGMNLPIRLMAGALYVRCAAYVEAARRVG